MNSKNWIRKIDKDWTLFLDRDGTINERKIGSVTSWREFTFIKDIPQTLATLNKYFGRIIIVSNQQGIGKELLSHETLEDIHVKMLEVFDYYDAYIDEIYYEPSLAVYDSYFRKPNPGMAMNAKKDYPDIDFKKSVMVGDQLTDILFGEKLGMKTIWIENEWENGDRSQILDICHSFFVSLKEFSLYLE